MTDAKLAQVTVIRDDRTYNEFRPGDIEKVKDGTWMICCPMCSCLGEIKTHSVTEHDDGTITISPSLVCHGEIYVSPHNFKACTAHYFVERNQIRWC